MPHTRFRTISPSATSHPVSGSRYRGVSVLGCLVGLVISGTILRADTPRADTPQRPSVLEIQTLVSQQLEQQSKDYRPGDLLTQAEVQPVVKRVVSVYGPFPDASKILEDTLSASSSLVGHLSTTRGRRLMRKIAGQQMIYDRLDRICHASGGNALVRDLSKLPDAERYTRLTTKRAVPDLLDLLPKNRSGRTRTIKDYDKPTGKIYTEKELVRRIADSYAGHKPSPPDR